MRRRLIIGVACLLLAVKAALGLWGAYALLTASPENPRSFLGETVATRNVGLGLVLLILAVLALGVVLALWQGKRWARPAAIGLELLAIALALSRIGSATGPAVLAILLGVVVIALLVGRNARLESAPEQRGA